MEGKEEGERKQLEEELVDLDSLLPDLDAKVKKFSIKMDHANLAFTACCYMVLQFEPNCQAMDHQCLL